MSAPFCGPPPLPASATFTFSSPSADIASFECKLDSGAWAACTTGDLWKDHPEKSLGMRADWVDKNPKAAQAVRDANWITRNLRDDERAARERPEQEQRQQLMAELHRAIKDLGARGVQVVHRHGCALSRQRPSDAGALILPRAGDESDAAGVLSPES